MLSIALVLSRNCWLTLKIAIKRLDTQCMCFQHSFPDCLHRVLISNLQTEIEKQIGHQTSRKRRSEFQYDYEVYHPLEDVSAWMKINILGHFYVDR